MTPGAPDPFDAAELAAAEPMVAVLERVAHDLEAIRRGIVVVAGLLSAIVVTLVALLLAVSLG